MRRRLRAALLATLAYGVALGVACCVISLGTPFAGPDASGWLVCAMIVAAVAGLLAVLLRLSSTTPTAAAMLLPALAASAGFLVSGGVLFGLGGGDPLKGPAFALSQFRFPGIYVVAALGVLAAAGFRMGTSPHRNSPGAPLG